MQEQVERAKAPRFPIVGGIWLALLVMAVLLQWRAGAFESGFGGHPDEGAHFVTGLMVRDYLVSGISQHPMRYAEDYYAHYPKVALGHYPPGFYALEAIWLRVFPVSRVSVLLLMATLCGIFGTLVFSLAVCRIGSFVVGAAAAVLAVVLPLTQTMTSRVMADLLVAILVLLAAWSFLRYVERGRWVDSLAYGLCAAAAVMTKGSALFLGLLPAAVILLTGRYRMLGKWTLWVAVLPVVLICGPWLWYSSGITSEGMTDRGMVEHARLAAPYFAHQTMRVLGVALGVSAVGGMVRVLSRPAMRREPFWAVTVATPLCLIAFHCAIPAGLEPRYLLPAVPFLLLLAVAGCGWLVAAIDCRRQAVAAWGIGSGVIGMFAWETFTIPRKDFGDYRLELRTLEELAAGGREGLNLLVASDARGEGAFISAVAMMDARRPSHTVARCSKVLSSSDWLGRGYREAFETDDQLRAFLDDADYDGILVDESIPEQHLSPHHARLARVLAASGEFVRAVGPSGSPEPHGVRGTRNSLYKRLAENP